VTFLDLLSPEISFGEKAVTQIPYLDLRGKSKEKEEMMELREREGEDVKWEKRRRNARKEGEEGNGTEGRNGDSASPSQSPRSATKSHDD